MGHYAKIDDNNIVIEVIVAKADFIESLPDKERWIKTSYNTNDGIHYEPKDEQDFLTRSSDQSKALRYRYAGIGMYYDATNDVFYKQSDYPSWVLNKTDWTWRPPIKEPSLTDEQLEQGCWIEWDEDAYQADNTKGWKIITP